MDARIKYNLVCQVSGSLLFYAMSNSGSFLSFRLSRFVSPRGEAGGYTVYKEGGPGYTRYIVYTDTRGVNETSRKFSEHHGYKRAPQKRGMSVKRTFLSKGRANDTDFDKNH